MCLGALSLPTWGKTKGTIVVVGLVSGRVSPLAKEKSLSGSGRFGCLGLLFAGATRSLLELLLADTRS